MRQLRLARDKLLLAQQQQNAQYDARHRARRYAVGDEVWVGASHLTQPGDRGLHKKLLKKRLGPLRACWSVSILIDRWLSLRRTEVLRRPTG